MNISNLENIQLKILFSLYILIRKHIKCIHEIKAACILKQIYIYLMNVKHNICFKGEIALICTNQVQ